MKHSDEKGHFASGQSRIARTMSGKAEQAFPGHGTKHTYKSKSGKHLAYSAANMVAAGRDSGAQARSPARARLKVIARGKANVKNKAYTKIGREFHKKGLLKSPV